MATNIPDRVYSKVLRFRNQMEVRHGCRVSLSTAIDAMAQLAEQWVQSGSTLEALELEKEVLAKAPPVGRESYASMEQRDPRECLRRLEARRYRLEGAGSPCKCTTMKHFASGKPVADANGIWLMNNHKCHVHRYDRTIKNLQAQFERLDSGHGDQAREGQEAPGGDSGS